MAEEVIIKKMGGVLRITDELEGYGLGHEASHQFRYTQAPFCIRVAKVRR